MKQKRKYYSLDYIDTFKSDVALIYGGRNIGKSYSVKTKCLKEAIESKGESGFGYWRRREKEIKAPNPTEYLLDIKDLILEWTDGEFDRVGYKKGEGYWLYLYSLSGDKKMYSSYPIGHSFAIAIDEQYKSLMYPTIRRNIFEEVFTRNGYLMDEPTRVLNLVSTIKREKEYCPLYMISNTVSKINPYVNDWSLSNLSRQKQGTVDSYKLYKGTFNKDGEENYYKIVTQYCAETEGETLSDKISKAMGRQKAIATGEWEQESYYCVKGRQIRDNNLFEELYTFVFMYNQFAFLCRLVFDLDTESTFIYVERKTSEPQPLTRIISNHYINSPFYTKNFTPINTADQVAFDLLNRRGCVVFADNLTGTDFNQCILNYNN